ncbi:hypothetical protein [Phycicoccus sp. SLBN-51]|uniref:hypothetical protein n=1 Tax=Phycicoccus sp. SLBN-51 TaxID=2768447 RepID=UPI00114DE77A|nr:hypothetical protein [Phycicoccus sp. SLBN-51]TQJ49285.1 hypothetical protein FBY26_0963 [Phycicoccus sp. SLBN-51]
MDRLTRIVTVRQMLGMTAAELLDRAAALRQAPPVPPEWERFGHVLEEQADLAAALAPLRVEFDDAQWRNLGALLEEGLEPDHAAALVRAGTPS